MAALQWSSSLFLTYALFFLLDLSCWWISLLMANIWLYSCAYQRRTCIFSYSRLRYWPYLSRLSVYIILLAVASYLLNLHTHLAYLGLHFPRPHQYAAPLSIVQRVGVELGFEIEGKHNKFNSQFEQVSKFKQQRTILLITLQSSTCCSQLHNCLCLLLIICPSFLLGHLLNGFMMVKFRQLLQLNLNKPQQFNKQSGMGNTCQNCQKPTEPKDSLKPELNKQESKVGKGIEETTSKPYRPSLSKNDEKYFQQLEQTGGKQNHNGSLEKREPVKFKNGVIYHGQWRGNVREGYGVQVWPDGAKYEGEWLAGKANGKGKFIHVDGDVYEGDWKEDKANGYGTYKHYNGAKYQGQWVDDYQHGKGIETWVDGSRYQGLYSEGKKNGEGKYTWKDGSYFIGTWKDNKINGYGVYVWSDGRQYKGNWLNNQMHGDGQYKWKDGRMYSGQYQYDKKHGFGTYTWADGRKYAGEWANSKRHGRGKIISVDGTEREGFWQQDRRVRWLDEGAGTLQSRTSKKP